MKNIKTTNTVIFWNTLLFLCLVLALVFFPTYLGAEDYVLSYGLFIIVLICGYIVFCITAGVIFSILKKKQIAQGFYLSALTIALIGVPSCYGGIFMRAAVL